MVSDDDDFVGGLPDPPSGPVQLRRPLDHVQGMTCSSCYGPGHTGGLRRTVAAAAVAAAVVVVVAESDLPLPPHPILAFVADRDKTDWQLRSVEHERD